MSDADTKILQERSESIYNQLVKRGLDLIFVSLVILPLMPILLFISVFVVIDSGFPVFYKAKRGGFRGKKFMIIKFRTMVKNADQIGGGTTALNDVRITRFGKLLRKTKLDELPQVFNILVGDMSFVGPRPELPQYTDEYCGDEKYILEVRPGITDYSSLEFISLDEIVGESNADEMYEKFVLKKKNELRLKYVQNISAVVDFKLFCLTVYGVIRKVVKLIIRNRN